MATFAVFIHTLVFKSIVTNKQGAMLYQAGYPFTFYFYWSVSSTLIWNNLDLTLVTSVGLLLNFLSMRAFHTYGDRPPMFSPSSLTEAWTIFSAPLCADG